VAAWFLEGWEKLAVLGQPRSQSYAICFLVFKSVCVNRSALRFDFGCLPRIFQAFSRALKIFSLF
jgi:hypothetical protein